MSAVCQHSLKSLSFLVEEVRRKPQKSLAKIGLQGSHRKSSLCHSHVSVRDVARRGSGARLSQGPRCQARRSGSCRRAAVHLGSPLLAVGFAPRSTSQAASALRG